MTGTVSKETHWMTAFMAAEKRPDGELVNVHGATLRAMERAGSAYRRNGKWYMQGKGPGPVEEPKIEEPKIEEPSRVRYTVQDSSMWQLHLDVVGAPDTVHPDQPGGALRPVGVTLGIGVADGVWTVGVVNVFGQKVKEGKVVTKRNYPLPFVDPLGEYSEAPEWLRKVCQDWVDKANGAVRTREQSSVVKFPVTRDDGRQDDEFTVTSRDNGDLEIDASGALILYPDDASRMILRISRGERAGN
jgi:hypothetical protein